MKTNTQSIARKIIFIFSFFYFLNSNAQALPPEKFSFQAVVRNSNNQIIANKNVGVRLSILSVVMGSENAEFIETHTVATNQNGLFSIQIGNGTMVSGSLLTAVNSNGQSKKIKCEIDPTGGTNYTIVSNEQLLSVPYALKSNSAVYANNADFATTATTASTATSANSVVGIAGNNGFVPVFGDNNALGNSAVFNDTESGNVGIHNQNPLVALDVAGNGTILARKRVVLGPVGGNPFISPIWAIDNNEYNFRVFKQPDITTPGTTHFTINSNGNASMSNNLSVVGDISTNKIIAGNNSSLGANSTVGTNFTISGSLIEKITVLHLTGNTIINYDVTDTDRNIIVKHDDSEYGRYRINLPSNQPDGRVLDVTLLFFLEPINVNRNYVEFTNLIPSKQLSIRGESYMAIGNGISLGYKYSTSDLETHSISHFKLIFSTNLNSWIVLSNNYSSATEN